MNKEKDCDWLSPVESERKWQEDNIKKIWPGYPNICPNWQILNGLIRMACDSVDIEVTNSNPIVLLNNEPLKTPLDIINYNEPNKPNGYIYSLLYNETSHPDVTFTYDYNEAINAVHDYFLSFGFEIKDGKPYDKGQDYGLNDDSGFKVFDNVETIMLDGELKIIEFMHYEGDGPVAYITKNNEDNE